MHEFILYSQIPASRREQVLHILAGVTGSQPVHISEQCFIYQQLKNAAPAGSKKGPAKQTQQAAHRLGYSKLLRQEGASDWSLRIEDVPEAGVKTVISRTVQEKVASVTDLERFQPGAEWNKFVAQSMIRGTRFVNGNIIIRLTRPYVQASASPTEDRLQSSPQAPGDLKLLDPSGAYLVEALVRAEDGSSSTVRDKAVEELLGFAETLKGAIDFHVPDRLALDTRVKGI